MPEESLEKAAQEWWDSRTQFERVDQFPGRIHVSFFGIAWAALTKRERRDIVDALYCAGFIL